MSHHVARPYTSRRLVHVAACSSPSVGCRLQSDPCRPRRTPPQMRSMAAAGLLRPQVDLDLATRYYQALCLLAGPLVTQFIQPRAACRSSSASWRWPSALRPSCSASTRRLRSKRRSRPQPARDTRGRGAATARGQRRGRRSRGHAALRRPALMMLGRLGYSTLTPADGRQRRRTLRPASPRDERSAARLKMPWMGSRAAFAQMHAHRARGPGAALLRVRAERRGAKPDLGGSYRPAIEAVPRGPSRTHVRASGSDDSALSTQRCPPGASRVPCHHGLASVASARAAASWRGAWCPSVARVRRRR
jgi:hypothetical protein